MRIEMHEANDAEALGGTPELWMRVMSDQLVDLPTAVSALDPEQQEIFAGYDPIPTGHRTCRDHEFAHGDLWAFPKRNED